MCSGPDLGAGLRVWWRLLWSLEVVACFIWKIVLPMRVRVRVKVSARVRARVRVRSRGILPQRHPGSGSGHGGSCLKDTQGQVQVTGDLASKTRDNNHDRPYKLGVGSISMYAYLEQASLQEQLRRAGFRGSPESSG